MDNASDNTQISTNLEAPVQSPPMPSTVSSTSNTNTLQHSLYDILERFVVIDNFSWTSGSKVLPLNLTQDAYLNGTQNYLKAYDFPQVIFDNSAVIRQKVNNFLFMRSDIEIEVKVNTTPFQQGELLMAYFPKSLNTSKFRAEGNEFLASVTSAPHKFIKLEQSSTATLTVPYANVLEQLDLTAPDNAFGQIRLYVTSSLAGATAMEMADIAVRARFVNPKLSVPTDNSLLDTTRYRNMELKALKEAKERAELNTDSRRIFGMHAQMAEGEKQGPVSKIASAVATIGEVLSPVPVIGKVGEVMAWIGRGVAGVASVFGWSKPVDNVMPIQTVARPAAYMGNTEGKDASHVLAQITDNAIDSRCMVPSNKDELALGSIWARPNTVGRYTVPKSLFRDRKLLFSFEASPFNILTSQVDSLGQDFALGSFSFSSMMGKLWRGSIEYSLRMVKTKYHAGRVVAVFFPNRTRLDLPPTLTEELTTNSHVIIDLNPMSEDAQSLEKPLVVPYTSNKPWLLTLYKNENGLYDSSTLNTCCGTVGVYVYTDLVCPETVAQEVTFLLSVKAGKDYEIAMPQIQLQAGFAPKGANSPAAAILGVLQDTYGGRTLTKLSGATGTAPDFLDKVTQDTAIYQSTDPNQWVDAVGKTIYLPDGTYTADINMIPSNTTLFNARTRLCTVVVEDTIVMDFASEDLTLLVDSFEPVDMSWSFTQAPSRDPNFKSYRAQMDEGASEPLPREQHIAPIFSKRDASHATSGEYFKSLRPLLKRFVKTCRLDLSQPVTITPVAYQNYDSTGTPNYAVGSRSWSSETEGGGLLKESWISLISYLFRFSSGSTRSKIFISFDDEIQTSLHINDKLQVEFNQTQHDPVFVTNGVISNAVETHVPYYSQYKARVIGDQLRGLGAKVTYTSKQSRTFDYFEAAGDDYNMWFMVGVPVMRPIDVDETPLGVVAPSPP